MTGPRAPRADSPYLGTVIAVGTRHGKQRQFAPVFHSVLGAQLLTPPDLDTDRFGTFTGEIARPGPATEAARAKARLAMEVTGLPLGLATEASYGASPDGWFGHEEIVLFCDATRDIEILEGYRSAVVPGVAHRVHCGDEVPGPLLAGLPDQALTVRPGGSSEVEGVLVKGVTDTDTLNRAIAAAVAVSSDGVAVVEPDLRAHHNPSRRRVLRRLAARLADRLATGCPECGTPGFGRVDAEPGLPCRLCDTPTVLVRVEIHGCPSCAHHVKRPVSDTADPALCPACNP